MPAILSVTIPFFALVLCGYLAARRGILPESAIPGLNGFVLFFALPCMLFRFGAQTPLRELLNPTVLGVYLLAAVAVVGAVVWASRRAGMDRRDSAFGALVAAFPNSGFMGVPLLVALMGPSAAGPVICMVLADMVVTSSLCLAIASTGSGASAQAGKGLQALGQALKGALSNPLPWAIGLGAALGASGAHLPGPADTVVRMLADAASPVALFTIGAVLWRAGAHARQSPTTSRAAPAGAPRPSAHPSPNASTPAATSDTSSSATSRTTPHTHAAWPVVLTKLLIHPALVAGLGGLAQQQGAQLSDFQLHVLVLASALPSASNVSLLAERHQADTGRVARIILGSTLLAFASFSTLASWLAHPAATA